MNIRSLFLIMYFFSASQTCIAQVGTYKVQLAFDPKNPNSFHESPKVTRDTTPQPDLPIVAIGNKVSVVIEMSGTSQILVRQVTGVWTWQEDGGKKGKKRIVLDASQEVSNSVYADLGTGVNFSVICGTNEEKKDVRVLSTSTRTLSSEFTGEGDTFGRIKISKLDITNDRPALSSKRPVPARPLKSPMVLTPNPDKYEDKPFAFNLTIEISQP